MSRTDAINHAVQRRWNILSLLNRADKFQLSVVKNVHYAAFEDVPQENQANQVASSQPAPELAVTANFV
jgi:hypothetical protein